MPTKLAADASESCYKSRHREFLLTAVENYRTALRHFARFLERPYKLADLNDGAVTAFAKLLSREKARQYLQHSTVATTIEHYLDEDQLDDKIARMCDLLPRPAKGGAA